MALMMGPRGIPENSFYQCIKVRKGPTVYIKG